MCFAAISDHNEFDLIGPVRDTPPPHIGAIPFRDRIAEGGIGTHFALFSYGIAQVLLRYPFGGGGIAPPLCMLSKGDMLRKGGGGIAPNWPCSDTKNPIARNRGASLR